jgi:pimeloyl-ACP methyl ester carboxylesterase
VSGPEPRAHRITVNGIELAYFTWGDTLPAGSETVLLAHATGFHARCWDQVVPHLGARRVIALDQRGHGRSEKTPITHWRVFGEDLSAFVRALELRDVVGVGHSMGGHAVLEAAAAAPSAFRRLVLIDPVIMAPDAYAAGGWTLPAGAAPHPTAKRKRHFASPDEMIARFAERSPYSAFTPAGLRDYCVHGLLPAPDGDGFELACPPEIEAAIYMTSHTNAAVYDAVRALTLPALVVRVKQPPPDRSVMDFSSSPTWPGLVGELRAGREIHLADRTHFLPMESPELAARLVLDHGAR